MGGRFGERTVVADGHIAVLNIFCLLPGFFGIVRPRDADIVQRDIFDLSENKEVRRVFVGACKFHRAGLDRQIDIAERDASRLRLVASGELAVCMAMAIKAVDADVFNLGRRRRGAASHIDRR